jgi:hypothetical protein
MNRQLFIILLTFICQLTFGQTIDVGAKLYLKPIFNADTNLTRTQLLSLKDSLLKVDLRNDTLKLRTFQFIHLIVPKISPTKWFKDFDTTYGALSIIYAEKLHYYSNAADIAQDLGFVMESKALRSRANYFYNLSLEFRYKANDIREYHLAAKALISNQNAIFKQIDELKKREKLFYFVLITLLALILIIISYTFVLKRKSEKSLKAKNKEIEEKQKDIIDSLTYARRIQHSLLPTEKYIDKCITKLQNKKPRR